MKLGLTLRLVPVVLRCRALLDLSARLGRQSHNPAPLVRIEATAALLQLMGAWHAPVASTVEHRVFGPRQDSVKLGTTVSWAVTPAHPLQGSTQQR